jgi:hypothetical protein
MVNVFFSYSHHDETMRNQLETHLAVLKREGAIDTYNDRRITAGKEFAREISEHLEAAQVVLLLVSPYFLDSDYCWDIEMKRAMERHEAGQARVISVILEHCDWNRAPLDKLLAIPRDGRPISQFPNQHEAMDEVTQAIRRVVEELELERPQPRPAEKETVVEKRLAVVTADIRSSNLRIRKSFTDRERHAFVREAFEYMSRFFANSLTELQTRNSEVETDFLRVHAIRFGAVAYVSGTEKSRCTIWLADRDSVSGDIAFAFGDSDGSSLNDWLSVKDDGQCLFLQPLQRKDVKANCQGAAEYFWELFIEPLQQ